MKNPRNVPKFLLRHYHQLKALLDEGCYKEADRYINSLDAGTYDAIVERAYRGGSFETIMNKIDELRSKKKKNEALKINNYDGDNNHIF